ncbi:MAG: hypothetical protein QHH10_06665 [Peptococcaceae bacterium]|jgi:nucleoside-triphosphatase THEP1|nr:hypothetical protein [Peptococcaceae bacterium]MDH7524981.1 hypothetical protein [Peptococcaceae bacterium]
MASNLFLTGPKRCGKSTLIRSCVKPYLERVGGFFVQRVMNGANCLAFRLLELSPQAEYEWAF